jgi:hypothetical protein
MDEKLLFSLLQFLLPLSVIVFSIRFLRTQYRILVLIRPENRRMPPDHVWLLLIPLFGFIWQFNVIYKICASIQKELNTPVGDSIFPEDTVPSNVRPTYLIGITYATILCITLIPLKLIKGPAAVIAAILWIIYFVQLARFKKKIIKRALLLKAAV